MPQLRLNRFSSFSLTEEELRTGSIFTEFQKCVIQNILSDFAIEKTNLLYDPEHPLVFVQREAELQGKIIILQHLLDCSDAAVAENLKLAIETSQSQDSSK